MLLFIIFINYIIFIVSGQNLLYNNLMLIIYINNKQYIVNNKDNLNLIIKLIEDNGGFLLSKNNLTISEVKFNEIYNEIMNFIK